ncbi:MAG: NAD(P)H-dependent amine dehydrogenase family protein [Vicinamibacterales bacterium]
MAIRVLLVGLGPIGAAVARQLDRRQAFQIVGAVDIDPLKTGKDAGDVLQIGRRLRVKVTDSIGKAVKATRPDVAVLCTGSGLRHVLPQFEDVLKHRVPIVTTAEEAAYPARRNRRLARRLDEAARKARVAVLGTGVNPGFVMDALPIALTAVCERVDRIEVQRVQDARIRRLPFQQKIGAGLTAEQFQRGVKKGTLRHVGFTESIQMIGDAMGWTLDRVTDTVMPRLASQAVESGLLAVDPGYVSGIVQDGVGYVKGEPRIRLHLEAYLGAPESFDSVLIEGSPRIYSKIDGGVHGDIATASMVVNSIAAVLDAAPGFRTMRDLRLPSFYSGR